MALGIVTASDQLTLRNLNDYWVVGELALTGEVRPVKGALAIALSARKHKKKGLILPAANAPEAAVVAGLDVYPVKHLREAAEFLAGPRRHPSGAHRPERNPRRLRRHRERLRRREGTGARQARHRGRRRGRP